MADQTELLHAEVTGHIRDAFYYVYNSLGAGFLEKVCVNAIALTLKRKGWSVKQQCAIKVHFEGEVVGDYFADLVVNDLVIVEIKAVSILNEEHEAQLLNYLYATKIEVGLLLNFGPKPEYKRRVVSNIRKRHLPRSSSAAV